jgi:hypothetical protein
MSICLTPGDAAIRLGIAAHELRRLHNERRLPVPLNRITIRDLPAIREAVRSAGIKTKR